MTINPTQLLTLCVTAGVLFCTSNSMATPIPNDLNASYGTGTHHTTTWQELENPAIADEFGIYWSVGGGAWGRENFQAGQTLQFQMNVHKDNVGTHYADLAKLWVDWDQDGAFQADDAFLFGHRLLESPNGSWKTPTTPNFPFVSNVITLSDLYTGELALRGRVTCSASLILGHDLGDWGGGNLEVYSNAFHATGDLWQGETEDWRVAINPVPEPATMLLFGTGLIGLAGVSRRKKK